MTPVAWVRSFVPDWAIVMAVSGVTGGVSAILAVAAYRETLQDGEAAIPIESRRESE